MAAKHVLLVILSISVCRNASPEQKEIHTRIIGGVEMTNTQIGGFLTALRYEGAFICGSSLITELIVITAAHCVEDFMHNVGGLTVEGGITLLTEETKRVPVLRLLIPEKYNEIEHDQDVAVLRLAEALQGPEIHTINLCSHEVRPGQKVKVSGWGLGQVDEQVPRTHVQRVVLPIVSHSKCKHIYANLTELTDSMICAGVKNQKDACHYDSGGPLVTRNELCGIVSFGVGCADEYPGVFTNIKFMLPWIQNAIDKLSNENES